MDAILERGLPASVDAERIILGAMLTDEEAAPTLAPILTADAFSIEKHRRIYSALVDLHGRGEGTDRLTLINELKRLDQLASVDGMTGIMQLDEGMPRISNLEGWVRIVQEKAALRRAIYGAQSVIDRAMQGDPEAIAEGERFYRELHAEQSAGGRHHLRSFVEYLKRVEGGLQEFESPKRHAATVPVPWPTISDLLGGGLRPGQLVVFAGRPSHGKSAAASQLAVWAGLAGKNVLLFSLEMSEDEAWQRIVACQSDVSLHRWRKGGLSEVERRDLRCAMTDIAEADLIRVSDEPHCTVASIRSEIRKHLTGGGLVDLVVVDYVQLMKGVGRFGSRAEEVSDIYRGLKLLAKELAVPVVALAQVKRYQEEDSKAPELKDLKESGGGEENADVVMFVWQRLTDRSRAMKDKTPCKTLLKVAKQRNGPIGRAEALFNYRSVRLEEERTGAIGD